MEHCRRGVSAGLRGLQREPRLEGDILEVEAADRDPGEGENAVRPFSPSESAANVRERHRVPDRAQGHVQRGSGPRIDPGGQRVHGACRRPYHRRQRNRPDLGCHRKGDSGFRRGLRRESDGELRQTGDEPDPRYGRTRRGQLLGPAGGQHDAGRAAGSGLHGRRPLFGRAVPGANRARRSRSRTRVPEPSHGDHGTSTSQRRGRRPGRWLATPGLRPVSTRSHWR